MSESLLKFLQESQSESTRTIRIIAMKKYSDYTGKSPDELVEGFSQKDARHLILSFQAELLKTTKQNTVRSYVSQIKTFYRSQASPVNDLKTLPPQLATMEHTFSTEDLRKMWHVADTRNKALLSVGCSLGWDINLILNMDKKYFRGLVKRARSEHQDFISFDWNRAKTGERIFGVLTPIALDSLERWIQKLEADGDKSEKLWNITDAGTNLMLKALVEEAGIVTSGTVRWHLLRKWLISTLASAGLSEWETKLVVGKRIPNTDLTYLSGLKNGILEKIRAIYPRYLSLVSYSNGNIALNQVGNDVQELAQILNSILNKKTIQGVNPSENLLKDRHLDDADSNINKKLSEIIKRYGKES